MNPIFHMLCFHPSIQRPEGIAGGDSDWRSIVAALECLTSIKGIASIVPDLPDWCPEDAGAPDLEFRTLLGPLLRLGVFSREWVQVSIYISLSIVAYRIGSLKFLIRTSLIL